MNMQVGGPSVGFIAFIGVAVAVLTFVVHVGFALGVWRDAQSSLARSVPLFAAGPGFWAVATLLGGVFVATAYWVVHHSALQAVAPSKEGAGGRGRIGVSGPAATSRRGRLMADSDRSMAGKTCLVTGATSGIGEATARGLACRGAAVVVVGRSPERCEAAAAAIRRESPDAPVQWLTADLSSQSDIRRLAREFLDRHDRLHVLVNNAGALFDPRAESVDGIEMTLALNHLGPFLLTNLLLDALKAGAPSRIVNVSSDAHKAVKGFDFDDPQARGRAGGPATYGRSSLAGLLYTFLLPPRHPAFLRYAETKLANLLFTYELARRLEGTGVTANALHPGVVATNFGAGNGAYGWVVKRGLGLVGISPQEGAATTITLATSPELEGVTDRYFVRRGPIPSSPASRDEAAARRLWRLSEELTGLAPPTPDGTSADGP